MFKRFRLSVPIVGLVALAALGAAGRATADQLLRPFVLASTSSGQTLQAVADDSRARLEKAGFQVIGEYAPTDDVQILCVTNPALLSAAAATDRGAYAAVMRVAVTEVDGEVEVSFNNPVYLSHTYRLETDLADVRQALEQALGSVEDFGAEGRSVEDLRDYNYAFLMEKFHHPWQLTEAISHEKAVARVEKGLASGAEGVRLVYEQPIPGRKQVLFGVAFDGGPMNNQYMDDRFIMSVIDTRRPRSSAHLPYEILVNNRKIESLHARFRIAINFPDLKMVGENSFMDIMSTPPSLEASMKRMVGAGD